jgi:hypothetical protein
MGERTGEWGMSNEAVRAKRLALFGAAGWGCCIGTGTERLVPGGIMPWWLYVLIGIMGLTYSIVKENGG